MSRDRSAGRLVAMVGRRSVSIVACALLATIGGAAASVLRPKSYQAEARVEVGAVGGLNGDEFVARIRSVNERVAAAQNVSDAAKKLGLDPAAAAEAPARTTVEVGPNQGADYVVVVSHRADDPDMAVRVAAAVADTYAGAAVDRSVEVQQAKAAEAAKAEMEAKSALDRAASARAAYVKENREFLEGAKDKLQATRARKAQLQETLDGLKQQRKELGDLLLREKPSLLVKGKDADGVEKETRVPNEQWTKLDEAVRAAESRLAGASLEMRQANAQEKELEELAKRTPEHEAKAASLAETETAARKTYEARAAELLKAEGTLGDLRTRGSLAVRAVRAPERPTTPSGPSPLVMAFAGLLVGAVGGMSAAFAKAAADRSFHQAELVSDFLGVPSLGAISLIETPAEAGARRAKKRRATVLVCALGVAASAAVVYASGG